MRALTVAFGLLVAGCGGVAPKPPPLSPQEVLRDEAPADAVKVQWGPFATVTFADTAVRVEKEESVGAGDRRDLSRQATMDAVALVASGADHVARAAAAARDGAALARVSAQADRVAEGAARVAQVATMTAAVVAAVDALGSLVTTNDDHRVLRIAADTHGRAHRAACATSVRTGGLDPTSRPSLACTIVRADASPTVGWKLVLRTSGDAMNGYRVAGTLERSPPGGAKFTFTMPDRSTPFPRGSREDASSFAVGKDGGGAAARLFLEDDTHRTAWIARDLEDDARDALAVSLAVTALLPWPLPRSE